MIQSCNALAAFLLRGSGYSGEILQSWTDTTASSSAVEGKWWQSPVAWSECLEERLYFSLCSRSVRVSSAIMVWSRTSWSYFEISPLFLYVEFQFSPHKFIKKLLRTGLLHSWGKKGQWDLSKKGFAASSKGWLLAQQRLSKIKPALANQRSAQDISANTVLKICCNVVLGKHGCLVYLTFHLTLALTAAERWQNFICLEN